MHIMRKFWIKMLLNQMYILPGKMIPFSAVVISAHVPHFLKFLVSLWSQVFFSAAPQFPEVSADSCSAPSLAQSLKTFFLPTKETRINGPAQKAIAPDSSCTDTRLALPLVPLKAPSE